MVVFFWTNPHEILRNMFLSILQIARFFEDEPMVLQIWGKQKPGRKKPVNLAAKLGQTTRDIMKAESLRKSQGGKKSKKVNSLWTKSPKK